MQKDHDFIYTFHNYNPWKELKQPKKYVSSNFNNNRLYLCIKYNFIKFVKLWRHNIAIIISPSSNPQCLILVRVIISHFKSSWGIFGDLETYIFLETLECTEFKNQCFPNFQLSLKQPYWIFKMAAIKTCIYQYIGI